MDLPVDDAVRTAHLLIQSRRPTAHDATDRLSAQEADQELLEGLSASTLECWTDQVMLDAENREGLAGAFS